MILGIILIVLVALMTLTTVKQSQRIKELEGTVRKYSGLYSTTKELLWARIIPDQQFPFGDMERMIERYHDESNVGIKNMFRKALTGKD